MGYCLQDLHFLTCKKQAARHWSPSGVTFIPILVLRKIPVGWSILYFFICARTAMVSPAGRLQKTDNPREPLTRT